MADLVRSTMEAMVPDLLVLMKKKVFTRKEVKEILKVRENFEYSFLRRNASKKDYLKAIEYEYELVDSIIIARNVYLLNRKSRERQGSQN